MWEGNKIRQSSIQGKMTSYDIFKYKRSEMRFVDEQYLIVYYIMSAQSWE